MKVGRKAKEFLKGNRKKYHSKKKGEDIILQKFINLGGREGAEKDFNSILRKAIKGNKNN